MGAARDGSGLGVEDAEDDDDFFEFNTGRPPSSATLAGVPVIGRLSARREKKMRRRERRLRMAEQAQEWHPSWIAARGCHRVSGAILPGTAGCSSRRTFTR